MSSNVGWQRFLYLYLYAFLIIAIGLLWTYGLTLFTLHPVFAVFAWVVSTGGTLSYRLWQKDSVPHARRRHRYMQQLACLSYAIALAGIVLSRAAAGKKLLSWSWHSIAGYIAMAAIGSQIVVHAAARVVLEAPHQRSRLSQIGRLKFDAIDRGERRFRWHGTAGTAIQYLTTLALVLGVWHVMGRSLDQSFSWAVRPPPPPLYFCNILPMCCLLPPPLHFCNILRMCCLLWAASSRRGSVSCARTQYGESSARHRAPARFALETGAKSHPLWTTPIYFWGPCVLTRCVRFNSISIPRARV